MSAYGVVVPDNGDDHGYKPISARRFDDATRCLDLDRSKDVLFDYGSGKGRAPILASKFPFRQIYGFEKSEELCRIAERSVRALNTKSSNRINIFKGCAATSALPDDVTVVFLFNPISGVILQGAIEQIRNSLQRNPRHMSIVYILPVADRDVF